MDSMELSERQFTDEKDYFWCQQKVNNVRIIEAMTYTVEFPRERCEALMNELMDYRISHFQQFGVFPQDTPHHPLVCKGCKVLAA